MEQSHKPILVIRRGVWGFVPLPLFALSLPHLGLLDPGREGFATARGRDRACRGGVASFFLFASAVLPWAGLTAALAAPPLRLVPAQRAGPAAPTRPAIVALASPEQGFFDKKLDFHGIPIKANRIVTDEALYAAYDRLSLELGHLPIVTANLAAAGAQLQIIGKGQVTSDLPDYRDLRGKPLPEYNGLTVDQRTRGLGGLHVSCGEENLLKLDHDRYRGRDICLHEFAHCIRNHGVQQAVRDRFDAQYTHSLAKGRWVGSYAASNRDEFFAELTMWYFGTHGDLNMTGPKPENGPAGLKRYDPDAYALFDDFYSGRIPVTRLAPAKQRPGG